MNFIRFVKFVIGNTNFQSYGHDSPQHDEVEPNLKKIPHRNGIWGLEANSP